MPMDDLPDLAESGPTGGTEGTQWSMDAPVTYEVPSNWYRNAFVLWVVESTRTRRKKREL